MSGHPVGGPGTLPEWLTMTQPRLAHQTPHGRMYARSLSGLPEVPSITTVIGMERTDLDGWIGWMAAQSVTRPSSTSVVPRMCGSSVCPVA